MYKLAKYEEALVFFEKAIELNSNFKNAYDGKAAVLNAVGQYREAIRYYNKVISLDPNFKNAYYGKGN